jgi:IgA Peptidase M64/Peptidase M64 N-terminus
MHPWLARDRFRIENPPAMRRLPVALISTLGLTVLGMAAPGTRGKQTSGEGPLRTLRVEYVHSGDAAGETFALARVAVEGPWPGPLDRWVDETNLGKYLFEVRDKGTNRLLYSRGFASVYGEWETTDEAKEVRRAFTESLRFPEPAAPVQVILKKRDRRQSFREVFSVDVDPRAPTVERASPPAGPKVWAVQESGPPRDKVDLLLLGDGYTAAEMDKWHADARRLADTLFKELPFRERRSDFNVWAIDAPADVSGVSRPSEGIHNASPFRATYDAFGSERYVLVFDERWREMAAAAPYEFVEIVVNGRKYGGGGIHNLYATVAADNAFTPYVFVHEFGHHFAGLADEYYTSEVAYETGSERVEPWERNATADPKGAKWADLVAAGTPLPTPWAKAEFETIQKEIQARRLKIRAEGRPESEMEALFREESARTAPLLARGPHGSVVGAFEGALYEAKGYYRPRADCIMFTRNEVGFCPVCRRALEQVIDQYSGR